MRQLPFAARTGRRHRRREALFGRAANVDEPTFTVKGANITPDPDSGIGKWSADDQKKAPSRSSAAWVPLAPIMPYGFYKVFTTGDLDAVVAYLRSAPAVSNKVQAPVYKGALHVEVPPGADSQ